MTHLKFGPDRRPKHERITARELEVLGHLSRGLKAKHIAPILYISVKTAECHITHILEKLEVGSSLAAVMMAIRTGIIDCPCRTKGTDYETQIHSGRLGNPLPDQRTRA